MDQASDSKLKQWIVSKKCSLFCDMIDVSRTKTTSLRTENVQKFFVVVQIHRRFGLARYLQLLLAYARH